jgi:hypothetical protein
MNILIEKNGYKLVDVKGTYYSGNYQILERFEDSFRTCGEYFNKKDAIKTFNKLTK